MNATFSCNDRNYEIARFGYLDPNEPYDMQWKAWSRIYEWHLALERAKALKPQTIHNTSAGLHYEAIGLLHGQFARELDKVAKTTHSDIEPYSGQVYYDITKPYDGKFDLVLNISTIEHLPPHMNVLIIGNMLNQLQVGGSLIITCDYPNIDLGRIENFVGVKCKEAETRLSGFTSPAPDIVHAGLNIVYFEAQRLS